MEPLSSSGLTSPTSPVPGRMRGTPFKRTHRKSITAARMPRTAADMPGVVFQLPFWVDAADAPASATITARPRTESMPATRAPGTRSPTRRGTGGRTRCQSTSAQAAAGRTGNTQQQQRPVLSSAALRPSDRAVSPFENHPDNEALHLRLLARRAAGSCRSSTVHLLPAHLQLPGGAASSAEFDVESMDDTVPAPLLLSLPYPELEHEAETVPSTPPRQPAVSVPISPLLTPSRGNSARAPSPVAWALDSVWDDSSTEDELDPVPAIDVRAHWTAGILHQWALSAAALAATASVPAPAAATNPGATLPSPEPSPVMKQSTSTRRRGPGAVATAAAALSALAAGIDPSLLGPQKTCASCQATKSAGHTWRTGWNETIVLCNQCGLRYTRNGHVHCKSCNYIPTKSQLNQQAAVPRCTRCRDPVC
ncbi:hypothetical protein AMAG_00388 [Allomyces macrogynus ATCC 38327]|uniref:GATA-type domain-containing protein n=1 Tax=Allomyces macrogynus (strain ATCC 38327) TaxID=578462 RepID=A0A0L0RW99_ALLM3|nr:hypothetical protein AMAG_00388 [Allomyces macrogynus ATCC 38327]|eukprot:KNE54414.1 hypothetical protein AMAG_00388 [Allomyces macrogynus ATCC 38327]